MHKTIKSFAVAIMMLLPMLALADFETHQAPAKVKVGIDTSIKPTSYKIYITSENGPRIPQRLEKNDQTLTFSVPKGDVRFGYMVGDGIYDCPCNGKEYCSSNAVQGSTFTLVIGTGGYHNCKFTTVITGIGTGKSKVGLWTTELHSSF